jgi:two-component system, OmpR family, phosphate regulon response regulator PhoB
VRKQVPVVLVVTEEPLLSDFLIEFLTPHGYTVDCAEPADSLARLAKSRVDLVLLDLGWPETTGLELCERMRARSFSGTVPIVGLTDLPADSLAVTGLTFGPNEYLSKPFDNSGLLTLVARYCSRDA